MKKLIVSIMVFFAASTIGNAANIWHEGDGGQGDAGNLPGTAQTTIGVGFLNDIVGSLSNATNGADMYEIYITDPSSFLATTTGVGANPIANPAVYLFDVNGNGIVGNDNSSGAQASISDSSLTAGYYYILIAASGHLPGHGSTMIFGDLTNTTTTSLPGTALQITKYIDSTTTPNPEDGGKDYRITLEGVTFAQTPEPGAFLLVGLGLTGLGWRFRRRNSGV